jgi:hypothetical protein
MKQAKASTRSCNKFGAGICDVAFPFASMTVALNERVQAANNDRPLTMT